MHKLIISLFVVLAFTSCQTETDELAQQKQKVVNLALTARDVVDAKWEGPELLVLTVKQGSRTEKFKRPDNTYIDDATSLAGTFVLDGRTQTGLPVCVKVVYPDGQELAYRCSKDL